MCISACLCEGSEVGTKVIYRIFGIDNDYLQCTQLDIILSKRTNVSRVRTKWNAHYPGQIKISKYNTAFFRWSTNGLALVCCFS